MERSGKNGDINDMKKLIVIAIILAAFLTSTGVTYALLGAPDTGSLLQKGLVGHWKLDGNARDATPNANHGTVTGATLTTDRKGQSNKAYNFVAASSQKIAVSSASVLALSSALTISVWVKLTTLSVQNLVHNSSATDYRIYYQGDGSLVMQVSLDDGNSGYHTSAAGVVTTGSWQHIVGTFDGLRVKTYKNGAQVLDEAAVGTIQTPGSGITMGGFTSEYLNGDMDDVRIYNRALSATEVTALYNSYDPGVVVSTLQKGLVGYWKLDNNAKDATPYESNLTNTNGVTFTTDRKGQSAKAGQFVRASSQYLSLADNAALSTGDIDFTASGWVYFDSFSTFVNILGKWNTTGDQREWILYWDNAAGKFHFAVSSAGTVQQGDVTADSAGTISTGQWYFVVVWHDASANTTNIQVNNGTATTTSYSLGVFNSTAAFQISGAGGAVNTFDGRVDDVRFYKKVLSAAERTALYESYK